MSKTYGTRGVAEPHNHQVYEKYLTSLRLKDGERVDLRKRGLNEEQINKAQYATKQINTALDTATALGKLKTEGLNLDNVPGFYINDKTGHAEQSKVTGLFIPVRDYQGHISSILCRNDRAKIGKDGKIENKYIAFSSAGKTKGNKVRQTTHCPIVKGKAIECDSTSIRITEGVLKADVATALGDKYCLGMQGLNIQDDLAVILVELEIQELIIAIDAGEDDNFDILRCKARLVKLCREIGIDFKIEKWDVKYGKGIDDVLASKNSDKIKICTDEEVDAILDNANEANYDNGDWVYNVHDQLFVNTENGQELTKSQFVDKFRFDRPDFVQKIITLGFKQVDKTAFIPNGERFVKENGFKCLNVWHDPKLVPMEGDIKPFIDHIEYMLPEDHQRNILFDWLSHNIQFPGRKIMWMLILIGDEGIGKSYLGWLMKQFLGERNVSIPTNEQMHEPYTDWQKNKCLVIIEELLSRGKIDLVNKLKPIITQPTTQIREMRRTSYEAPNRLNIFALTNHDDPILIGEKDRRFGVIKSEAKMKDDKYYTSLWSWTREPRNLQSIYHFFMSRDLSKFNPEAKAPMTKAKLDMVDMSISPLDEWIKTRMDERAFPFNREVVIMRHIKDKSICPNGLEKYSDKKWAQALTKSGAEKYKDQIKLSDKSKGWPWLIGERKELLKNFTPTEIAKIYENTPLDYKGINPIDLDKFESNIVPFGQEHNPIKDDEPL